MKLRASLLIVLLLVTIVAAFGLQKRSQNQLTDSEFISRALSYHLSLQYEVATSTTEDGEVERIFFKKFDSNESFLSAFPGCCTYAYRGTEGYLPSAWDRFFYNYAGTVVINGGKIWVINGEPTIRKNGAPHGYSMNRNGEIITSLPRNSRF